jgi:HEPN domain-containing protein
MDNAEYAREWLSFADMDLKSAEYLLGMQPVPMEIICYHCQQSAEKCLKGLLLSKGIDPPRIHDMKELCHLCEPFLPNAAELLPKCIFLNPYGVQPRYPRQLTITGKEMNEAIKDAKAVYAFIQPFIRQET